MAENSWAKGRPNFKVVFCAHCNGWRKWYRLKGIPSSAYFCGVCGEGGGVKRERKSDEKK